MKAVPNWMFSTSLYLRDNAEMVHIVSVILGKSCWQCRRAWHSLRRATSTKQVPQDKFGQLLGATKLLHAVARVVGLIFFNSIHSTTMGSFRQTVFVTYARPPSSSITSDITYNMHCYF
jgi:hypothetical protein